MSAWRRIAAVARVEARRLLRSPVTFTLLLLVPALQVVLFGAAIRPDAAQISVAIAAPTPVVAAKITQALSGQPGLVVVAIGLKPGGADAMVRARRALIGVEAPIMPPAVDPLGTSQPLRIIADAGDATLTASATSRIEAAYWRALAQAGGVTQGAPGLRIERLYNPEMRANWTFMPSLIGVTVMISMIMLGSLSLAREREAGTWEALLSLPVSPVEVMTGKLAPYVVIGTVQGALVLLAGVVLFDLPTRGSVAALAALLPLFAAAHLVLGYAISARAKTQLAALQGAVAFYLPAMLLSGFLYPFETLPTWARAIGEAFPLTHFIRAAREALLRGSGAAQVASHAWPMLGFLAAAGVAALLAHARRLD